MTRSCSLALAFFVAAVPALAEDKPADAPQTVTPALEALAAPAPAPPSAPAADVPSAAAPAPAAEAAPPAAAPADVSKPADVQGSLSVTTTPSGKLFLDGSDSGLTTPVVDLPVGPGKHTLKIVGPGGVEQSTDFEMEAGGALSLNLNLPEPTPAPAAEVAPVVVVPETAPQIPEAPAAAVAVGPWTWMTVAGWGGLGLGTMGLLSGAVVLTTPGDPDQEPLGFSLFGAGVGLVIGGGVMLYLDTELAEETAAAAAAR